jgi:hypothetical protein
MPTDYQKKIAIKCGRNYCLDTVTSRCIYILDKPLWAAQNNANRTCIPNFLSSRYVTTKMIECSQYSKSYCSISGRCGQINPEVNPYIANFNGECV